MAHPIFDSKNPNNNSTILSYLLKQIKKLQSNSGGNASNLQAVTDEGNETNNNIVIIGEPFPGPSRRLILTKPDAGPLGTETLEINEKSMLYTNASGGLREISLGTNGNYTNYFPNANGPLLVDAPEDSQDYARNNGAWVAISPSTPSELQKLTEGSTGWRLLGKDPLNYGNIGSNAVDFSHSDGASATRGATAPLAFACNYRTTASGNFAFASGSSTTASGFGASANGQNTVASGGSSFAVGFNTITSGDVAFGAGTGNTAPSGSEAVVGMYATNYAPLNPNGWDAADRAFNVGNGTANAARSDAFTVFKNGTSVFGGPARLKTYTVVTLPAGVLGDTAIVTDATAPTYLGALVGGGAVVCPVFYNGSAWVSH